MSKSARCTLWSVSGLARGNANTHHMCPLWLSKFDMKHFKARSFILHFCFTSVSFQNMFLESVVPLDTSTANIVLRDFFFPSHFQDLRFNIQGYLLISHEKFKYVATCACIIKKNTNNVTPAFHKRAAVKRKTWKDLLFHRY